MQDWDQGRQYGIRLLKVRTKSRANVGYRLGKITGPIVLFGTVQIHSVCWPTVVYEDIHTTHTCKTVRRIVSNVP